MNVFDHYYDKVSKEELSKEQLLDIVNQLLKLNSFGSNQKSALDLGIKMSQSKNSDDDVIRKLLEVSQIRVGYANFVYRILDNGSKSLFDDVWKNGIGDGPLHFWKCKFADEKQLTEIYKEYFGKRDNDVHGQWLADEKNAFFKHPNAPDKLLSRKGNTNDQAALIQMASNPNITEKPKVFEIICDQIKTFRGFNTNVEKMIVALLGNTSLDWMKVAKGIELPKQLDRIFGKKTDSTSLSDVTLKSVVASKVKTAYIEFCKRDECPDNVKAYMYGVTGDESFLPQAAKDVFLF